jgi:hypothetical protein
MGKPAYAIGHFPHGGPSSGDQGSARTDIIDGCADQALNFLGSYGTTLRQVAHF